MKLEWILSIVGICTASRIFQGDCSDEKALCEQLCLTVSEQTYECSCWQGHRLLDDGYSCKVNTKIQYSNKSPIQIEALPEKEESIKPLSFKGKNYAEFQISEDTYLETNITLQFRLEERIDGILLFGGQMIGDDFLSLTVEGPNIILRHDCGEGTIEDMYHARNLTPGVWHEINVWRRNCDSTQLKVDMGKRLVDDADQFRNFKGITIDEGIFIGGAPKTVEFLKEKTGAAGGFVGCVRKLIINNHVLLDTVAGVNRANDPASLSFCGSHTPYGSIKAFDLTQDGFPEITDEVDEVTAPTTHKMTPPTTTTPETTTTTVQERREQLKIAHFDGASWLSIPAPDDIQNYLHFSVQFKPETTDGVLFHWTTPNGRYIVATLEGAFVKVYASLGGDSVEICSRNVVSLFRWHKLEVWRSGKGVLFKVNRQPYTEAFLHSENVGLEQGTVYVGGFERLPSAVHVADGFAGCLKRLRLNGNPIPIVSMGAQNITQCLSDPCANYGCPSSCVEHHNEPVCMCRWPTKGAKCQLESDDEISAMSFSGQSYAEIDSEEVMSHITGDSLNLLLNLKLANESHSLEQVVLSAGDVTQEDDFLYLAVNRNNQATFSMNLGSGSVELTHPTHIVPGRWTTVQVVREERTVQLTVNGEDPIHAILPEGSEQLNVYRSLFLGGEPEGRLLSQYPKSVGLDGCVISLRVADTIINHPKQVKQAVNIEDCSI